MPPVPLDRIPRILDTRLAFLLPGVPVAFEGPRFKPPNGLWARPTCKTGDTKDGEKGRDGYSRRIGIYFVDVFLPGPGSTGKAWETAKQVEDGFRRLCLDGIQTEDPNTKNLGFDASSRFHLQVVVPWWCWAV